MQNPKLVDFVNFTKFPKKTTFLEKFELPDKRGFKFMEKRTGRFLHPQPTLTYKLSVTSVVWNIPVAQLGLAAWLCSLPAPAHLLVS